MKQVPYPGGNWITLFLSTTSLCSESPMACLWLIIWVLHFLLKLLVPLPFPWLVFFYLLYLIIPSPGQTDLGIHKIYSLSFAILMQTFQNFMILKINNGNIEIFETQIYKIKINHFIKTNNQYSFWQLNNSHLWVAAKCLW